MNDKEYLALWFSYKSLLAWGIAYHYYLSFVFFWAAERAQPDKVQKTRNKAIHSLTGYFKFSWLDMFLIESQHGWNYNQTDFWRDVFT